MLESLPLVRGDIERVTRGVYRLMRYPVSPLGQYMEAALWPQVRRPDAHGVISHESALAIYGLSDASPAKVHVTLPLASRVTWPRAHRPEPIAARRSRDTRKGRYRRAVIACGYTTGMKTAVSLPDRVFREAEGYAKRTRKSRSQLYAEALAEYLARHAPDEVTEAMNVVVDTLGDAPPDTFVQRAGQRMLRNVEW